MAFRAIVHIYESERRQIPVASVIYFYKNTCNVHVYKFCDLNRQELVCDGSCVTTWQSVPQFQEAARQSYAVDRCHKLLVPSLEVGVLAV